MNKAILIGRLGQDPKVANTQTGTAIVNFSLATDESYTGQDGNKIEKTEWHRVVAFGKQAEFCANYLSKGRLVLVEGNIQTRKWQDQDGRERYTTEIRARSVQALDPKSQQRTADEGWARDFDKGDFSGNSPGSGSFSANSKSRMDDDYGSPALSRDPDEPPF